jgi:hypothetical protein
MELNVTRWPTAKVHGPIVIEPESEENLGPRKRQTAIPSTSRVPGPKAVKSELGKRGTSRALRETTAPHAKARFQSHETTFHGATIRHPIERIPSPQSVVRHITTYQFANSKHFAPSIVQHSTRSAPQTTFKSQRQLTKVTPDLDERVFVALAVPHGIDRR